MAKKKSAAQIRRLQLRAEQRGEEYVAPPEEEAVETTTNESPKKSLTSPKNNGKLNAKKVKAATKLKQELLAIQNNEELRAKERRSHKRKAEAIAAEEAGCSVEEMQKWYEDNQEALDKLLAQTDACLLYTSPSPRDQRGSRMPSSA